MEQLQDFFFLNNMITAVCVCAVQLMKQLIQIWNIVDVTYLNSILGWIFPLTPGQECSLHQHYKHCQLSAS